VKALAERFADAEGIPDAADTVAELAGSALASDALAAARAAGDRVWREVPVVAPVGDRLVEGYVDLLFEAPDGSLVVVDWKTDRARTDAEVDAALDRYRLQGAGYAVAVEAATERAVSSVRFVFCRGGGEPAVEREVDDLDDARQRVASALARSSATAWASPSGSR
jgi:ATP-dependent helicase/nuclease subunit A